jgi:hypothetical protein
MAEYADREHYIPLRKSDLVELLCRDKQMPRVQVADFRQFCTLISAVFHFEYLTKLEHLKDRYAPFDPDCETEPLQDPGRDGRQQKIDALFDEFCQLMERANFKRLAKDDIQGAVEGGASDWGVNMYVDFSVFERLEMFVRGEGKATRVKRGKILFWRKTQVKADVYHRLALAVKLRKHKRIPENVDTDDVFFKLFKDIPPLDIEMVLPGTQIMMPRAVKYKMSGTALGTIGYAVWKVWATIIGAVGTIVGVGAAGVAALLGPLGILGGYGYKQWYSYQVTRQTFSKMLTESLYYQTLDNNAGVLTRLLDEAEEQECREAILAYYCLWRFAPPQGWSAEQLDDYVEMYLEGAAKLKVDFEIGDAIEKVERLGVVEKVNGLYRAVALPTALEKLDYRWDNYFQYNKA